MEARDLAVGEQKGVMDKKGSWKGANLLDVPNDLPTDVWDKLWADPIRLSPVRARSGTPHCIAQRSPSYREEERFEGNAVYPDWQRAAIAHNVISRNGQRHWFTHRGSWMLDDRWLMHQNQQNGALTRVLTASVARIGRFVQCTQVSQPVFDKFIGIAFPGWWKRCNIFANFCSNFFPTFVI
jgi:hypothetical protein